MRKSRSTTYIWYAGRDQALSDDKSILKQYAENDQVVDNGKVIKTQSELVPALSDNHQPLVRPLMQLHDKSIILTCINPQVYNILCIQSFIGIYYSIVTSHFVAVHFLLDLLVYWVPSQTYRFYQVSGIREGVKESNLRIVTWIND